MFISFSTQGYLPSVKNSLCKGGETWKQDFCPCILLVFGQRHAEITASLFRVSKITSKGGLLSYYRKISKRFFFTLLCDESFFL